MALWSHFQVHKPLIGFSNMLNLDQERIGNAGNFLLEFSWAVALQDLTEQNLIAWSYMVGFKHAVCNFTLADQGLDPCGLQMTPGRLTEILDHIRQYSAQTSACTVTKVMTSKGKSMYAMVKEMRLISPEDADQRVIYDIYSEKHPSEHKTLSHTAQQSS
jgi:hypothetical protein